MHSASFEFMELRVQSSRNNPASPDNDAEIRDWLIWVLTVTNMKPTPLAKKVGLSPSTLLRALDVDNPVTLERRSINKIVEKLNLPRPGAIAQVDGERSLPAHLGEPELVEIPASSASQYAPALGPTQSLWRCNSRSLELAGVLDGDFILADSAVTARPKDIVVAQIVRTSRPGADIVLRLYDPPYLLTATMHAEATAKPVLVDSLNVSIRGVAIKTWRERPL